MANKRYVVELSAAERARLVDLISKGKSPAKAILKARILLKADQGEGGEGRRFRRDGPGAAAVGFAQRRQSLLSNGLRIGGRCLAPRSVPKTLEKGRNCRAGHFRLIYVKAGSI